MPLTPDQKALQEADNLARQRDVARQIEEAARKKRAQLARRREKRQGNRPRPKIPEGAYNHTDTRALLYILTNAHPTLRSTAAACGVPLGTLYARLGKLKRDGLVTWEKAAGGTLRPLVQPVAFGEEL